MKKAVLVLGALLILTVLSCKKDRGCDCYTAIQSGFGSADFNWDTLFYDVSKKEAELKCNALQQNATSNYFSFVTTCELK